MTVTVSKGWIQRSEEESCDFVIYSWFLGSFIVLGPHKLNTEA